MLAARALAYIRGREYVVPEDLGDLALDVLRHRLVLSYEALSDEVTADLIISKIVANMSFPEPAGRGPPYGRFGSKCFCRPCQQSW